MIQQRHYYHVVLKLLILTSPRTPLLTFYLRTPPNASNRTTGTILWAQLRRTLRSAVLQSVVCLTTTQARQTMQSFWLLTRSFAKVIMLISYII